MLGAALTHLVDVWASMYANHAALRTIVGFAHVGGLVAGGGSALAADLAVLRAHRMTTDPRAAYLPEMRVVHRVVLAGLAAVLASGVLLTASDLDTFLHSRLFWAKMALVLLLAANGAALVRAERIAGRDMGHEWTRLRWIAAASIALWLLVTLAGSALLNVG